MEVALAIALGLVIGAARLAGRWRVDLAVPVLVYIAGQEPKAATVTSLVAGAAAVGGVVGHARADRAVLGGGGVFAGHGRRRGLARPPGSTARSTRSAAARLLGAHPARRPPMLTACPSCTKVGEASAVAAPGIGRAALDVAGIVRVVLAGSAGRLHRALRRRRRVHHRAGAHLALGMSMPIAIGTSSPSSSATHWSPSGSAASTPSSGRSPCRSP
ncbi:MAG: hypothetical protein R2711_07230 [Acidimicrobiales bacterium]